MNEIKIDPHRLESGALLSNPRSSRLLIQAGGIAFGICQRSNMKLLYGFASSSLARFVAESKNIEAEDALIINQMTTIGPEEESETVLKIIMSDGSLLILDSYDHIYRCTPYVSCRDRGRLLSPNKVWGLPAQNYMAYMLLTERMIDFLETRANDGQHAHLLKILWREYQLATEHTEQKQQVSIEGEFLDFTAREFAHGLVIFDTV